MNVDDLMFVDRVSRTPEKPAKPKLDVEAVRERIEQAKHSIVDHIYGEIAALKKFLRSKEVSTDEPLDEFRDAIEASWRTTVEAVEQKLDE